MLLITKRGALRLILLFAIFNSSIFIALSPSSVLRLFITILMNIAGVLLILNFYKVKLSQLKIHIYFKILLTLLISWCVVTFLRGFSTSPKDLISLFGHYLMGWAWLTPLAFVFGLRLANWLCIFDFVGKLLLIGVVLTLFALLNQEIAIGIVEWVVVFPVLMMTFIYQKRMNQKIVILSVFSFLLLSFFASQRANLIFLALVFMFTLMEYLYGANEDRYKKIVLIFVIFVSTLVFISSIENIMKANFYEEILAVDTRTFLFLELFDDLSSSELILGRGALGTYYSPYFEVLSHSGVDGGDHWDRQVNEVGYLQMILKGGLLMMVLHLLILLPAAFLGVFKSNNIIARMSGYYIITYLLMWSVSYYSVFSAEYILLWVAVGTTVSSSARKISNSEFLIKSHGRLVFGK